MSAFIMAALDLSCLESGVQRHSAARQCAGPAAYLAAASEAQFQLPEVDNVMLCVDLAVL